MIDEDTAMLVATAFGIVRYSEAADSFTRWEQTAHERITCMAASGDSLWYGTLARGLKVLDRRTGQSHAAGFEGVVRIVAILPVASARVARTFIVVTDRSGVFRLDPATGVATPMVVPEHIMDGGAAAASNEIRCAVLADSLVWMGTEDAGCVVYDPSRDRWGTFTYYEGLLTDQVRSLCDSPRWLLIGCYGGLHKLDKRHPGLERAIFGPNRR
jgi:ligand-binding sensor domain-containing protein